MDSLLLVDQQALFQSKMDNAGSQSPARRDAVDVSPSARYELDAPA